jgi:hypothetical protein
MVLNGIARGGDGKKDSEGKTGYCTFAALQERCPSG